MKNKSSKQAQKKALRKTDVSGCRFIPILFSTPMVQAILGGKKTQTRREIKPHPSFYASDVVKPGDLQFFHPNDSDGWKPSKVWRLQEFPSGSGGCILSKHYNSKYNIGDIIWVRETWQHTKELNINAEDENYGFVYKSDGQPWENYEGWKWKPSIFMPKAACRLFLEVTGVRVERLHDISDSDIVKEGAAEFGCVTKQLNWEILWQKINGVRSWNDNPWVWVIEFIKTDCPNGFR